MTNHQIRFLRDRLPEEVFALLAKQPDLDDRSLTLQDYRVNNELIIPLFSSMTAIQESFQGADLERPVAAINRGLLASMLHGNEVFLLDPGLRSELRFTADELWRTIHAPRTR